MAIILKADLFDKYASTFLGNINGARNLTFMDQLNNPGSFSFSISKNDPTFNFDNLIIGNTVKIAYGNNSNDYVFAGVIESITVEAVGNDAEFGRIYQVQGRGIRALLEYAVTHPLPTGSQDNVTYTDSTPGGIFRDLMNKAHARGVLTFITNLPAAGVDYYGEPYEALLSYNEPVGNTLDKVMAKHIELAVDAWVTPDLQVCYANQRGQDKSNFIILRIARDIASSTLQMGAPVINKILAKFGNSINTREVEDAASITTYGKREGYLSLSTTDNTETTDIAINKALNNTKEPTNSITLEIVPTSGYKPYIDYNLGDFVKIEKLPGEFENYRVSSITITQDQDNNIKVVPEFGTLKQTLDIRLNRILSRLEEAGALGSNISVSDTLSHTQTGGAATDEITVTSYNPATRTGTGEVGGTEIPFINTTPYVLTPGDVGLGIASGGSLNLIGVKSRAPIIDPGATPTAALADGYPFDSGYGSSLIYSFVPNNKGQAYDYPGLLGQGGDTILSLDYYKKAIYYVSILTNNNGSIGAPVTSAMIDEIYLYGTVLYVVYGNIIYYRDIYLSSTWSTYSNSSLSGGGTIHVVPGPTSLYLAGKYSSTNELFFGQLTPSGFIDIGHSGLDTEIDAFWSFTTDGTDFVILSHSNAVGSLPERIKVLKSTAGGAMTKIIEVATSFTSNTTHLNNGYVYGILTSGTEPTYYMNLLEVSTGTVSSYDTGISVGDILSFSMTKIGTQNIATMIIKGDYIGGTSGYFYPAIASWGSGGFDYFYADTGYPMGGDEIHVTTPYYIGGYYKFGVSCVQSGHPFSRQYAV